jgi:hypothetical protein
VQAELLLVVEADDGVSLFLSAEERRQEEGGNDRGDRDNDEQFD